MTEKELIQGLENYLVQKKKLDCHERWQIRKVIDNILNPYYEDPKFDWDTYYKEELRPMMERGSDQD